MFVQSSVKAPYINGAAWISMCPSVVLCGQDGTLLHTRKLVLEQAGLHVHAALGVDALDGAAGGVLVLCFTLSKSERRAAVKRYRSHFPGAKVLALGTDTQDLRRDGCETLTTYPGPEMFIRKVRELVAGPGDRPAWRNASFQPE